MRQENQKLQPNKMGTMPITRLLVNMALPMIISMLVQALYNVVDSIYVSRISESAVTALSLAFPVQNIQIGFATGIGVGVNALLSKSLGQNNRETANRAAGNGIFLVAIVRLPLSCLVFSDQDPTTPCNRMWRKRWRAERLTSPSAVCFPQAFLWKFWQSVCFRPPAEPFTL